jgi:hypothetical protein
MNNATLVQEWGTCPIGVTVTRPLAASRAVRDGLRCCSLEEAAQLLEGLRTAYRQTAPNLRSEIRTLLQEEVSERRKCGH